VAPDVQARGIGKLLMAEIERTALSRSDVFDGLSVILVRAMSGRPHSGNALPLHLRDRHQHTFVYFFYPFSCPVLTLVQLTDDERFLYSRRLQRDAQAAHNFSLRKRD
jgi:GNAT superfamily N-acetyltransferase